jgi:hypothetical protein
MPAIPTKIARKPPTRFVGAGLPSCLRSTADVTHYAAMTVPCTLSRFLESDGLNLNFEAIVQFGNGHDGAGWT